LQFVTVRGVAQIAGEALNLSALECDGRKIDNIRIEYGPKRQYDFPLVRDRHFRTFQRYLTAENNKTKRYDVTATFIGRFEATASPRLIIESVTDVDAKPILR